MIKKLKQHFNIWPIDIDDVLFIYIPLIGLAISVPALLVVIGSIIVKALS